MTASADRRATISALLAEPVDVLVVGGGIVGCGIARDAALRGLRVALVEQRDLAWGTTSRPTRLIHGGLRYLETFDFDLVRSDLREREILLHVAPHLVFPLRFLLPHHRASLFYRSKLRAGMVLYDLLSFGKSLPRRDWLSPEELIAEEPGIRREGLQGAWSYYDAQVPLVERLVVENALDAAAAGARVLTHARVERYLRDTAAAVTGAAVCDEQSGRELEVRARITVNATGAWLDITNREVLPHHPPALRLTKGVHLVTPSGTRNAIVQFARSDGRLFFVTPWRGYSLIGTTDTDYEGDPAAVGPDESDVRYLQTEARRAFPDAPFDRVHYASAGVRALVRVEGVSEGEVSRKHAVIDHARRDGIEGFVSVVGGKITAYRLIGEEVGGLVSRKLGWRRSSPTAERLLPGGDIRAGGTSPARDEVRSRGCGLGLDERQCDHLVEVYGSLAHEVLDSIERDPTLGRRVCARHETTYAELVRAVEREWAVSLADVLLRRTTLGLEPSQATDCLDEIAEHLGRVAGWDATDRAEQIRAYRMEIAPMRRFSTPA